MITITDKTQCCGCSTCQQVCPQQCIDLVPDSEGYWYPKVDKDRCIECHLCEKRCPVLHQESERVPLSVYAAKNKDEKIRAKSASGGMFTIMANQIIKENGIVYGVKFDSDWNVVFDKTETLDGLEKFRRSKYVQAWLGDTFKNVKKDLQEGRKVMFVGTPCQVAGLRSFLHKEYDNLLLVDLICEGVPSPKVWKRYLKEELARQGKKNTVLLSSNHSLAPEGGIYLKDVSFRDKSKGWKKFSFALSFGKASADAEKYSVLPPYINRDSAYMQCMMHYIDLRPICYECPFKSCKSHSDITIADYWGITYLHPEMDDDKGTSMVFVNTEKGRKYFDLNSTNYLQTTYEETFKFNNVVTSSKKHKNRDVFFAKMDRKKSIIRWMNRCTYPIEDKIKQTIKAKIKIFLKAIFGTKNCRKAKSLLRRK